MYIYETVNFDTFARAFQSVRPDNFSTAGLSVLYEYLDNLAAETGEPLELDVIALCCDYSEETLAEVNANYNLSDDPSADNDDLFFELSERTQAFHVDADTVIYQVF